MHETAHQHAYHLIPWLVNETIAADDRSTLESHLAVCAECRRELEQQQRLRDAMRQSMPIDRVPSASLNRLWRDIEAHSDAGRQTAPVEDRDFPQRTTASIEPLPVKKKGTVNKWHAHRVVPWLAAAVILEAIGITWLVGAQTASPRMTVSSNSGSDTFRTVSVESAASPNGIIRVVFAPEMNLAALDTLLKQTNLQIVSGPTPAGVYTLAASPHTDAVETKLAALRAQPQVKFAERIDALK